MAAVSLKKVTMPTDDRTKRQKGDDYPLAAVSSLKKGWAEQADAFGNYLTGKTPDEVKKLATDDDGKPKDADLLSTCTIAVDGYRDAVVRACENAKAVGSARGDRAVLGVSVRNDTKELTADDDHDVTAQVDITVTALTLDADGRDRCSGGCGRTCPYRGRGWYGVGTGDGQNQGGTGRQLRDARGIQSGQGMVRAQRGLVRLPEGQDPY